MSNTNHKEPIRRHDKGAFASDYKRSGHKTQSHEVGQLRNRVRQEAEISDLEDTFGYSLFTKGA